MSDEDTAVGPGDDTGDGAELWDQVADLVVFAPLGLALEGRRLYPELVARGRRQVLFTRTIGRFAVKRGRQHLDDLVGTGVGLVSAWLPTGADATTEADHQAEQTHQADGGTDGAEAAEGARPELRSVPTGPSADHLAIPDYDSLSAFQVMPRLQALDHEDLDAVRAYEEATRGRRTILNKIAQLG